MAGAFPILLINEIAFCRGEMSNLLQARPRPPKPPPGPTGGGKGDRKRTYGTDGPGSASDPSNPAGKGEQPAKPKGKAKAKATANPPPKGFDPSWFRTINGKETCMRFPVGKCTKEDCRFFHGCPVPLPNGKAWPHTALEHGKTPLLFLCLWPRVKLQAPDSRVRLQLHILRLRYRLRCLRAMFQLAPARPKHPCPRRLPPPMGMSHFRSLYRPRLSSASFWICLRVLLHQSPKLSRN